MERPTEYTPSDKIITISNGITAMSAGLIAKGLHEGIDTPKGLAEVAGGKLGDVIDGLSARQLPRTRLGQWLGNHIGHDRTGTSTFGAKFDPVVDRFSNAAIFFGLARKQAAPSAVLGTITAIGYTAFGASTALNLQAARTYTRRAQGKE